MAIVFHQTLLKYNIFVYNILLLQNTEVFTLKESVGTFQMLPRIWDLVMHAYSLQSPRQQKKIIKSLVRPQLLHHILSSLHLTR